MYSGNLSTVLVIESSLFANKPYLLRQKYRAQSHSLKKKDIEGLKKWQYLEVLKRTRL